MRPRQVEADLASTVLWQVSREGHILLRFEASRLLSCLCIML
jgi:hypothetical protein